MHTLSSVQSGRLCELEVALTVCNLTETAGQLGRQEKVSIGMHPKVKPTASKIAGRVRGG